MLNAETFRTSTVDAAIAATGVAALARNVAGFAATDTPRSAPENDAIAAAGAAVLFRPAERLATSVAEAAAGALSGNTIGADASTHDDDSSRSIELSSSGTLD